MTPPPDCASPPRFTLLPPIKRAPVARGGGLDGELLPLTGIGKGYSSSSSESSMGAASVSCNQDLVSCIVHGPPPRLATLMRDGNSQRGEACCLAVRGDTIDLRRRLCTSNRLPRNSIMRFSKLILLRTPISSRSSRLRALWAMADRPRCLSSKRAMAVETLAGHPTDSDNRVGDWGLPAASLHHTGIAARVGSVLITRAPDCLNTEDGLFAVYAPSLEFQLMLMSVLRWGLRGVSGGKPYGCGPLYGFGCWPLDINP